MAKVFGKNLFLAVFVTAILAILVLAGCARSSQVGGPAPAPTPGNTGTGTGTAMNQMVLSTAQTSLGEIVTGQNGLTVYVFKADSPGNSVCYNQCAQFWPPVIVPQGVTPVGQGISGTLGTIQRDDGSYQVTINGWPLYYFFKDTAQGDVTGQGIDGFGGLWWVVDAAGTEIHTNITSNTVAPRNNTSTTNTTRSSSGTATGKPTVMAASSSVGRIMTDAKGMTLYVFSADSMDESTCTGTCAEAWPPLLVSEDAEPLAGSGVTATLGTIERDDGTYQLTANGLPLYYYVNDKVVGDLKGEGINANGGLWYAVSPAGNEVHASPGGQTSSTTGLYANRTTSQGQSTVISSGFPNTVNATPRNTTYGGTGGGGY